MPLADVGQRRQWALDQTQGRGADAVIQAATAAAVPEGLGLVRQGGRYLSIGGGGPEVSMPVTTLGRMVTYTSILMAEPRHWLQAVRFLATRTSIPFERMITGRYTLDQTTEAIQAMADFREVKPVIFPN
jgi:L-iditol 2-dehydrogenase